MTTTPGAPAPADPSPEPTPEPAADASPQRSASPARAALTLGALGIVFGDIGTSPIYTIQTVFDPSDPHPVAVRDPAVFGVASLIFWTAMIVVTIKYVLIVLRADNDGEGGILSLTTLLTRDGAPGSARTKIALTALGLFGASLFFGDSMITPAISVLSAVEGLELVQPGFATFVVPITVVIIVLLFLGQRVGTAKVGRLFGPVMLLWFLSIGLCGIYGLSHDPSALRALSPTYAVEFLFGDFGEAFFSLAAVVLAITGAEALYADLGHFGRPPIARAWLVIVFPACTLSYLGQAALILDDPRNARAPFFLMVPDPLLIPLVVLATAATVIASQAVITGAFSVSRQAVQLGYLPRLRILHTSTSEAGQIYVPWINWVLMVAVLVLVVTYQSSSALAYAFGMAVVATINIGTVLLAWYARTHWHLPLPVVLAAVVVFSSLELLLLAANMTKLAHGAWLPLTIALLVFLTLMTWRRGRERVTEKRNAVEGSLRDFVDEVHESEHTVRIPGTAVYLNRDKETTPLAMRTNVEHNHVLHEHVVVLTIETLPVPVAPDDQRIEVDALGWTDDGIVHVTARYGYAESPDVPDALRQARRVSDELSIDPEETSYFVSTIELKVGDSPGMPQWRKRLFVATAGIASDAADYFNLPRDRTLLVGSVLEV
ncbi:KUP/HAK/KT family potassium transporter [Nocardioides flavescens]|uniref:Probable potassium transport system protein Kup n=1 Tax=Nocardioides flavescens TaxID=2691959 RepID=A0A6L7ESX6_9ACTN|nr:potassium transporter Kup [Nocardioides flavescens]